MASERRLLKWAVLKMWTPRQGSPRNLGLAVAQTISADWNPNCVWLAVSQLIERQHPKLDRRRGDLYAGGLRKGAYTAVGTQGIG